MRLEKCRDFILEVNEKRYNINTDTSLSFEQRLETMTNAALQAAERMLGLKSEGEFFMRLYKVRHECWDRIFLPDMEKLRDFPKIKRSIKDLGAGEAWFISRHQELADFSWYFKNPVPAEETALHLKVEYVQNLWDFANRSMGGTITTRVNILPKKIIIQAAPVLELTSRLDEYKKDKKNTISAVLSQLEEAYINCINEIKINERM